MGCVERVVGNFWVVEGEVLIAHTNEHLARHDVVDGEESLSHVLYGDLGGCLGDACC